MVPLHRGDVIVILDQYTSLGSRHTFHFWCIQLEAYKNKVDDKLVHHSGAQTITTNEGYIRPLFFENGLPYIPIRLYTDKEWETLPHIIWTSDMSWNPTTLDHTIIRDDKWISKCDDKINKNSLRMFDEFGNHYINEEIEHVHDDNHENTSESIDFIMNQHHIYHLQQNNRH